MTIHTDEFSSWYDNLDEAKADGFIPVKIWSTLSFFQLKGRSSVLSLENLEPIPGLSYCVYTKIQDRYYVKEYRGYGVEEMFFYRKTLTFSGEDAAIESLQRYVTDGNLTLLLTKAQFNDISTMLSMLHRSVLKRDGKLPYKTYISLLDE